jgi:hypothetical protein
MHNSYNFDLTNPKYVNQLNQSLKVRLQHHDMI